MRLTIQRSADSMTPELRRVESMLSGAGKRQLLRAAGREFWQITRESFGANGTNRAKPWPALSAAYQKRIKYHGPPKLIRTGVLMNSIRLAVDNNDYAEVFTECPYASVHQYGGNHIPARPFFPVLGIQITQYALERINRVLDLEVRKIVGISS